jgi:long-chain acyl-CoA synthetase
MGSEKGQPDTFTKFLLKNANERGDRPAIREKSRGIWRTLTWRELADEAKALAAALSDKGLRRGAHVAFLGGNRPRLYAGMCATHWLGGVVTPLFSEATAAEIAPLIQSAEVTHVFAEDQEQVDKLLEIQPRCPSLRYIIFDKDRGMRHYKQAQILNYAELLQAGRALGDAKSETIADEAERGSGQDVASLLFTTGAVGPVRGVIHTHAALIDRARAACAADKLGENDITLAYLPPAYIGQHLVCYAQPLVSGCSISCPESSQTLFSDLREIGPTYMLAPASVLDALVSRVSTRMTSSGGLQRAMYRAFMAVARQVGERRLAGKSAFFSALPYSIGEALIYAPLRDRLGLSRIRAAYLPSEGDGEKLLLFFRSIGVNLKQMYGGAEAGFFVAMQRDGQVKADTAGSPAQDVELQVTPQREILVRSPGLFREYLRDPNATSAAKTSDGWFRTGDAGIIGEDGAVRIIDRVTDLAKLTSGAEYSPRAIENKIKFSPYVREAIAFGAGRDTVCALIDIDTAAVGGWADKNSVTYSGHADLASREEVHGLIAEVLAKVNAELAKDSGLAPSQVRRFALLHKELDADDGVLTRMRELRRDVVAERYRPIIEAMHEGRASVRFEEQIQDEHDRAVIVATEVLIRDVPLAGETQTKKAA